jgi:transcriptional regulator with XRE-family HTH domain
MRTDPLGRRVLKDAPFAMRQLAADAGLSYDVLRSWRSGRRRPSRASALRLAAGLEGRGERLLDLARELRAAAQEPAGDAAPARASQDGATDERPQRGGGAAGEELQGDPPGRADGGPDGERRADGPAGDDMAAKAQPGD